MSTQKAFVMQGDGKASVVSDYHIPKPRNKWLGVKVSAVALNPTDWKHIAYINTPGSIVGCDFAGTVETTGEGYKTKWNVGDRICGVVHGSNSNPKDDGAFAEHIQANGDLTFPIPKNWSDEEAATFSLGALTCGQGLFQAMGLNLPNNPTTSGEPVLVYGGSTATGALGIQFVKLAGYTPITTCSPRNFEYVKSLGAAAAFNYNDADCADQIKAFTNNKLKYAWDTISLEGSVKICAAALASGGSYASLLPVKEFPRDDVKNQSTLLYTMYGEPINKGFFKSEALPDHYDFGVKFAGITRGLIDAGKLRVHRPKVMDGGLEGIQAGLDLLKNDKVSGEKLVYKL